MELKIKELNKIVPLLIAKGYTVNVANYSNYSTIRVVNFDINFKYNKVIQESNIDSILTELKQLI